MKQAKLPSALRNAVPAIATMEFGHTCYTVPWAMWCDQDELLWLHPDYDVAGQPRGTCRMRIELQRDGYHVWPARGHAYRPQDSAGYAGRPSQDFIPVAVLEMQS